MYGNNFQIVLILFSWHSDGQQAREELLPRNQLWECANARTDIRKSIWFTLADREWRLSAGQRNTTRYESMNDNIFPTTSEQ